MPKKLAKGSLLSVRFADSERKILEQAAKREEAKLSEYARAALLSTILVFDDRFALISSRPASPDRARAIARVHLNAQGNAVYLYDFTIPGQATKVSRGLKPEGTVEKVLAGGDFPVPLRRLDLG